MSAYPSGRQLFEHIVGVLGPELVEQWKDFLKGCAEIRVAVDNGLPGNISCRACWRKAGVNVAPSTRHTHAFFVNIGCACAEAPVAKKRKR